MQNGNGPNGVTDGDAEAAVEAARMDLGVGFGGRRIGIALIKALPLYAEGDSMPAWYAISDGERDGAIKAKLSGSQHAVVTNCGEDPVEELTDRLRHLLIPDSGDYFDQLALAHPIPFSS
jgi:hypothetical protein